MAAGKQQATFSLNFESNAAPTAQRDADAFEQLRARITGGQSAVKEMSAAMGRLRGSTVEVKQAKDELKAKIDAERAAISAAQLALIKAGTSYDALAQKTKKLAQEQELTAKKMKADEITKSKERTAALSSTVQKFGGPLATAKSRLDELKEAVKGASSAEGLATLAVAGLTAAIAALAVAAVAGGAALAKWVIQGANAARTSALFREAVTGNAADAQRLGDQITLLATKVSTPREELEKLALSLAKQRISGKAAVDTLNLVAQASDAMGSEVGSKLEGIVTRGKLVGRFGLNPRELYETGLEFKDVAGELAKNLHISLKDAQTELFNGQVKLDDGAKALRGAVEKRFAGLNARKMLDLGVQADKFKTELVGLTRDVNLDPLVKSVGSFHELLSDNTVTGRALKELITDFGNGTVKALAAATPIAKSFFQGLIIGALEAEIAYYKVRNALNKAFGDKGTFQNVDLLKTALVIGEAAAGALAYSIIGAYAAVRLLGVAAEQLLKPWFAVYDAFTESKKKLGTGWDATGRAIVDGLVAGLKSGVTATEQQIEVLAGAVKKGFKSALGIQSPSKVFAQYGEHTAEGYAQGVESGSDRASGAAADMVRLPSRGGGGGRASAGPIAVHLEVHIHDGGEPKETAKAVTDGVRALLPELTRILEEHALGGGIPVGA